MGNRTLGLAVGCVDVGDRGRIGTAPRSIIAGIGPELAGLGSASIGIEDGCGSLVGEQLGRTSQMFEKPLVQGPQEPGRPADPVGQRHAVERHALASIDLGLVVKWKMIGVLGHDDVSDQRLGRQAALDQTSRGRHLDDAVLTGPTGILGPPGDQDEELGGIMSSRSAMSSPILCAGTPTPTPFWTYK